MASANLGIFFSELPEVFFQLRMNRSLRGVEQKDAIPQLFARVSELNRIVAVATKAIRPDGIGTEIAFQIVPT